MKKSVCFISLLLLALLCFYSCSDSEDDFNSSAAMQIYGRPYHLTNGVIWKNNPNILTSTLPYVYKDIYTNEEGVEVTDEVTGFTIGKDRFETGNFMLSLYEDGLVFNEELQNVKGKGACVCFHLASPDVKRLVPGKYLYGENKKEFTFVGYCSSAYDTQQSVVVATISEGEVIVEERADGIYTVIFHCKTTFGGELSGEYQGALRECKVPLETSASFKDVALAGLMDTVTTIQDWFGSVSTETTLDESNGAAFFSSATGICKFANDKKKESLDIALVWDKKREVFYFESPIRMRSLLGHSANFEYPCHTIYMRAPNTFTDEDYNKLEETGFTFPIQEERVEFEISSFQPGYVFFETGTGSRGVMHIKRFSPLGVNVESMWDVIFITTQVNPTLGMDVKCPANFVNPKIR
ncbi:MAG: hypothetical protein RR397_08640 [Odoribacter sp.]